MKELKLKILHMLISMFQEQESYSVLNYEQVDDFYAMVGYNLESEQLLHELDIHSTSDLQSIFIEYLDFLDGSNKNFIETHWN